MKFCIECNNMYYIGISETDGNKMIYYCRNCGYKDEKGQFEMTNKSILREKKINKILDELQ